MSLRSNAKFIITKNFTTEDEGFNSREDGSIPGFSVHHDTSVDDIQSLTTTEISTEASYTARSDFSDTTVYSETDSICLFEPEVERFFQQQKEVHKKFNGLLEEQISRLREQKFEPEFPPHKNYTEDCTQTSKLESETYDKINKISQSVDFILQIISEKINRNGSKKKRKRWQDIHDRLNEWNQQLTTNCENVGSSDSESQALDKTQDQLSALIQSIIKQELNGDKNKSPRNMASKDKKKRAKNLTTDSPDQKEIGSGKQNRQLTPKTKYNTQNIPDSKMQDAMQAGKWKYERYSEDEEPYDQYTIQDTHDRGVSPFEANTTEEAYPNYEIDEFISDDEIPKRHKRMTSSSEKSGESLSSSSPINYGNTYSSDLPMPYDTSSPIKDKDDMYTKLNEADHRYPFSTRNRNDVTDNRGALRPLDDRNNKSLSDRRNLMSHSDELEVYHPDNLLIDALDLRKEPSYDIARPSVNRRLYWELNNRPSKSDIFLPAHEENVVYPSYGKSGVERGPEFTDSRDQGIPSYVMNLSSDVTHAAHPSRFHWQMENRSSKSDIFLPSHDENVIDPSYDKSMVDRGIRLTDSRDGGIHSDVLKESYPDLRHTAHPSSFHWQMENRQSKSDISLPTYDDHYFNSLYDKSMVDRSIRLAESRDGGIHSDVLDESYSDLRYLAHPSRVRWQMENRPSKSDMFLPKHDDHYFNPSYDKSMVDRSIRLTDSRDGGIHPDALTESYSDLRHAAHPSLFHWQMENRSSKSDISLPTHDDHYFNPSYDKSMVDRSIRLTDSRDGGIHSDVLNESYSDLRHAAHPSSFHWQMENRQSKSDISLPTHDDHYFNPLYDKSMVDRSIRLTDSRDGGIHSDVLNESYSDLRNMAYPSRLYWQYENRPSKSDIFLPSHADHYSNPSYGKSIAERSARLPNSRDGGFHSDVMNESYSDVRHLERPSGLYWQMKNRPSKSDIFLPPHDVHHFNTSYDKRLLDRSGGRTDSRDDSIHSDFLNSHSDIGHLSRPENRDSGTPSDDLEVIEPTDDLDDVRPLNDTGVTTPSKISTNVVDKGTVHSPNNRDVLRPLEESNAHVVNSEDELRFFRYPDQSGADLLQSDRNITSPSEEKYFAGPSRSELPTNKRDDRNITGPSEKMYFAGPSRSEVPLNKRDDGNVIGPSEERYIARLSRSELPTNKRDGKNIIVSSEEKYIAHPSRSELPTNKRDDVNVIGPSEERYIARPSRSELPTKKRDDRNIIVPSEERYIAHPSRSEIPTNTGDDRNVIVPLEERYIARPPRSELPTNTRDDRNVIGRSEERYIARPSRGALPTNTGDDRIVIVPLEERYITRPPRSELPTNTRDDRNVIGPSEERYIARPSRSELPTNTRDDRNVNVPLEERYITRPSRSELPTNTRYDRNVIVPLEEKYIARPSRSDFPTNQIDNRGYDRSFDDRSIYNSINHKNVVLVSNDTSVHSPDNDRGVGQSLDESNSISKMRLGDRLDFKSNVGSLDKKGVVRPSDDKNVSIKPENSIEYPSKSGSAFRETDKRVMVNTSADRSKIASNDTARVHPSVDPARQKSINRPMDDKFIVRKTDQQTIVTPSDDRGSIVSRTETSSSGHHSHDRDAIRSPYAKEYSRSLFDKYGIISLGEIIQHDESLLKNKNTMHPSRNPKSSASDMQALKLDLHPKTDADDSKGTFDILGSPNPAKGLPKLLKPTISWNQDVSHSTPRQSDLDYSFDEDLSFTETERRFLEMKTSPRRKSIADELDQYFKDHPDSPRFANTLTGLHTDKDLKHKDEVTKPEIQVSPYVHVKRKTNTESIGMKAKEDYSGMKNKAKFQERGIHSLSDAVNQEDSFLGYFGRKVDRGYFSGKQLTKNEVRKPQTIDDFKRQRSIDSSSLTAPRTYDRNTIHPEIQASKRLNTEKIYDVQKSQRDENTPAMEYRDADVKEKSNKDEGVFEYHLHPELNEYYIDEYPSTNKGGTFYCLSGSPDYKKGHAYYRNSETDEMQRTNEKSDNQAKHVTDSVLWTDLKKRSLDQSVGMKNYKEQYYNAGDSVFSDALSSSSDSYLCLRSTRRQLSREFSEVSCPRSMLTNPPKSTVIFRKWMIFGILIFIFLVLQIHRTNETGCCRDFSFVNDLSTLVRLRHLNPPPCI